MRVETQFSRFIPQLLESGLTLDVSETDTMPRLSVKIGGQSLIRLNILIILL